MAMLGGNKWLLSVRDPLFFIRRRAVQGEQDLTCVCVCAVFGKRRRTQLAKTENSVSQRSAH